MSISDVDKNFIRKIQTALTNGTLDVLNLDEAEIIEKLLDIIDYE